MFPSDFKTTFGTGQNAPSYASLGADADALASGLLLGDLVLAFFSIALLLNLIGVAFTTDRSSLSVKPKN